MGLTTCKAQPFPQKPIRIIVPFTPGSATDTMARPIADRLGAVLGQPVTVENRPGAGGTIGIGALAKSAPDGYTLAVVSTGHVVNPVLYASLTYDTLKGVLLRFLDHASRVPGVTFVAAEKLFDGD